MEVHVVLKSTAVLQHDGGAASPPSAGSSPGPPDHSDQDTKGLQSAWDERQHKEPESCSGWGWCRTGPCWWTDEGWAPDGPGRLRKTCVQLIKGGYWYLPGNNGMQTPDARTMKTARVCVCAGGGGWRREMIMQSVNGETLLVICSHADVWPIGWGPHPDTDREWPGLLCKWRSSADFRAQVKCRVSFNTLQMQVDFVPGQRSEQLEQP